MTTASATRPRLEGALLGAVGLGALVLAWWLGTATLLQESPLARSLSPGETVRSLFALITGDELLTHVLVSLRRVGVGLMLALIFGVPTGYLVGSSHRLDAATSPAFQLLRMISPLSWMPVAIMVLGVGDQPIYFLLAFAGVWPILLSTASGVQSLDPGLLDLGASLSATRREVALRIVLPAVLGHVVTGIRLAVGVLWIVLVPCEMLGVSAGLGYYVLDTRDRLAYSELVAMIVVIGALGFALDYTARALGRRFTR
ncbi:MAG: ABC transporter permease [Polyangiales bacterium]